MRNMYLLIAAAAAGTLLGCGQKGPLVLPDAPHPQKRIGVGKSPATPAAPAPSSSSPRTPPAGSAPQPAAVPQPQP